MLYSIDDLKHPIANIPHEKEFNTWRSRLSSAEYDAIIDELNDRINGTAVQTSSWMPTKDDWKGSVFNPIYSIACGYDEEQSGLFFGLLVWITFMNRPEDWSFGRYEKDGIPIRGMTYFRINL